MTTRAALRHLSGSLGGGVESGKPERTVGADSHSSGWAGKGFPVDALPHRVVALSGKAGIVGWEQSATTTEWIGDCLIYAAVFKGNFRIMVFFGAHRKR
ncbi:hypothetical protein [Paraburkholderia saeva]|uniref:hypothetical protein n=1 Tax=Paraburkholderia saeva TaxID=2777537 RepID=UPI001E3898EB|nr:hypothetical protein [Paraburkholderia saeva]